MRPTVRRPPRRFLPLAAAAGLAFLATAIGHPAEARPTALVYIDGTPMPVYFNDGDSFRILDGHWRGTQARLKGFNTLENYGPVHKWGTWRPGELYNLAEDDTFFARRGVWHCFSDNGHRGTYGRLLLRCPDLAMALIQRGFAHAMQIDDTPSPPEYLRAQQDAIEHHRGMWAHGVPDFIVTSLHSPREDPTYEHSYNRLVSTRDGHSEKWEHTDDYSECQMVCHQDQKVDIAKVTAVARELRNDPHLARLLRTLFNIHLIETVARYARLGEVPAYLPEAAKAPVSAWLAQKKAAGELGQVHLAPGACMLYVDFHRRYGRERASCLSGHGQY